MLVDLIADLGEAFGAYQMADDAALLDVITSANVACGFHAGDPLVMNATAAACAARGIAIGAHPAFPDLKGFGRRAMDLSHDEVCTDTLYQMGALDAFAMSYGAPLTHVTPHGRLGNLVVTDDHYAAAVLDAVRRYHRDLIVVTQAGRLADLARASGVRVSILGIADRAYNPDGTLVRRTVPGSVITDPAEVADRVARMVIDGVVDAVDGTAVPIECDSVLLHGDTPGSIELAHRIRDTLVNAGVTIAPMEKVLSARHTG